jgi:anti-sigma factor RsiW
MKGREDDIELVQYADGELSARDREAVAKQLESDEAARTKLESLAQMRELVEGHLELAADEVPDHKFAAMWREVNKAIDEQAPRSVWGKITAWIDHYRGHVITGALSAGAVAAIALIMRPDGDDRETPRSSSAIEVLPAAMRAAPVIESLDTPDGTGTVMNFEDEDGHTTVIWVTPADTVEGI